MEFAIGAILATLILIIGVAIGRSTITTTTKEDN